MYYWQIKFLSVFFVDFKLKNISTSLCVCDVLFDVHLLKLDICNALCPADFPYHNNRKNN